MKGTGWYVTDYARKNNSNNGSKNKSDNKKSEKVENKTT